MTNITGSRLFTITAEANETYSVDYGATYTVNILNHTGDIVTVSDRADFADDGTVARCLRLEPNAFYNGLTIHGQYLYISAATDGDVTLVRVA